MKIVNPALPTGKKFFPIPETHKHLAIPFQTLFRKDVLETFKSAHDSIKDLDVDNSYWHIGSMALQWEILSDEEYPILKVRPHSFRTLAHCFSLIRDNSKSAYASPDRIGFFNIPLTGDHIKVQYDPHRVGLIVHDCPYEGELVNNKPMVVNRDLKSTIREVVGEIEVRVLIGNTGRIYMGDQQNPEYMPKSEAGAYIADKMESLLDDTYTEQDVASICAAMNKYRTVYYSGYSRHPDFAAGTKPGYYLDTERPKNNAKDDFDFTAGVRTKFIYRFGGYNLPDNYKDWFDG